MPTYKFRYFNVRAFGELPRLMFVLAGQEFEDIRIPREEWPALKPKTPLGQLPVLEIDGKFYPQSNAIYRYLAKIFGFYGNGDLEALEMDQVLGVVMDIYMTYARTVFEKDEAVKAEKMKDLKEVQVPLYFGMFEKLLKKSGSTGFFVGKKISLADASVFDLADKMSSVVKLEDYPLVKKCSDNVLANPRIKAYLEKRPVTEM
ncbi:glutathione S-transferase-like [Haliotis rubra]|uniref:glutathione S-transferase-like n=1 Tax=Haliotis rubra TaxID=36100 RepID=UPI001EE57688|nr:glutathione S-transferase-like [Haliotis rubra]XP_046580225.1 glutathione S-transferase-like [Haliotis rubra]